MGFLVEYPVYLICTESDDIAIEDVLDTTTGLCTKALLVFTDHDGAEEYRDKNYPGWRFAMIPDEPFFARLLLSIRARAEIVAFDPYRPGTRPSAIPIDELVPQLRGR